MNEISSEFWGKINNACLNDQARVQSGHKSVSVCMCVSGPVPCSYGYSAAFSFRHVLTHQPMQRHWPKRHQAGTEGDEKGNRVCPVLLTLYFHMCGCVSRPNKWLLTE